MGVVGTVKIKIRILNKITIIVSFRPRVEWVVLKCFFFYPNDCELTYKFHNFTA